MKTSRLLTVKPQGLIASIAVAGLFSLSLSSHAATLEINQDSIGDLVPSGNGGVVPTIDTTELTTQVLVGNGETVVLGGVFRTVDVESESKVPVLGDIPYLGRLFTNTSVTQEKTETLIFITPRILADTLID